MCKRRTTPAAETIDVTGPQDDPLEAITNPIFEALRVIASDFRTQ